MRQKTDEKAESIFSWIQIKNEHFESVFKQSIGERSSHKLVPIWWADTNSRMTERHVFRDIQTNQNRASVLRYNEALSARPAL